MARLGDYIEQIRGVSYKPEDVCASTDSDAVAILRANNIQDDGLIFDDLVYVKKDKVSIKQYIQKGDIVVCASSGSKNLVGKAAIATENLSMAFGAFCKVVRPKKLMPRYIGCFFQSPKYRSTISELSGGANINNIRNEHIDELDIAIVSEEEQERIIKELVALSNLISLRKQQLAKLDEFVKARFVELFGEPLNLLDSGKTIPLEKAFSRITVGFVGEAASSYVEVGVPYLRTQNVRKGYIDFSGLIYVSEEFHNANQKSKIKPGDIVVSRVGVNRGMAAVIPQKLEEANIANCLIISKEDSINSTYLAYYLNMSYGLSPKFGASVGSAQGVINTAILKKWEVFLPSFAQQEKFAAFVEQTDKSKSAIQQSLDKLETLRKALMQKYFG